MKLTVVLDPQPEGGFTVQCVEIPGAISEGETEKEALENIVDAIEMVLHERRAKLIERPTEKGHASSTSRVVEVNA